VPKPTPKPAGPSIRAAAILRSNAIPSTCPKRDTVATAKPIAFALLLDSIPDRARGESMTVHYDVCGLEPAAPFSTHFTLKKTHQFGLGKQKDHEEQQVEKAIGPRSPAKWTLDMHEMSAGTYTLEVLITAPGPKQAHASRDFVIRDK